MKIFSCDEKKVKWYKKVNWISILVCFILVFLVSFCFFHFFIGGTNMMRTAIKCSFEISFLISSAVIVSYCIKNRINIYVVHEDDIYVIYPHSYGVDYDDGYIKYEDFRKYVKNEENVLAIIENVKKHIGIDLVKINKVTSINKNMKSFCFKADVVANEWFGKGGFFSFNEYVLEKKKCNMKFVIPFDYNKSLELYDVLNNKI